MSQVGSDSLLSMKHTCIPNRPGKPIGLGKQMFTPLQILDPHPLNIGCKVFELAPTVVSMPMEYSHQYPEIVLLCLRTEWGVLESFCMATPNVITKADILAKRIHQSVLDSERILGTVSLLACHACHWCHHLQLSTSDHVCHQKDKAVPAQCNEDARLIEDPPHF